MASIVWEGPNLGVKAAAIGPKLELGIAAVMSKNANNVQSYARANAPWTDRTGNARNGLFAKYSKDGSDHRIDLFHSVPYGIWLEVKNSGQYAILLPTIRVEAPRIMGELRNLMLKLGAL